MNPTQALLDWLVAPTHRALLPHQVVGGFIERLRAHLPIERAVLGLRTTHPAVAVVSIRWTPERGVHTFEVAHELMEASLARSPLQLLGDRDRVTVPLAGPQPYPLLDELREAGMTEYLILRLPGRRDQLLSLATRAQGGFTEAQLALLDALRLTLSLRLELAMERHGTWSLLCAYLGRDAAQRVLHGQYRRGAGEPIDALLFTCDLRGFTRRVDAEPLEQVLASLDRYFECVAEPWVDAGGEVLKFIGDAVLGLLPVGDEPAAAAARALAAARTSFERLASQPDGLQMGYALHRGVVMYGNIGSRARVDFTVIGPAVNEVSRVESLTKELAPLLLTGAFVDTLAGADGLRSLGARALRGVGRPTPLFTDPTLAAGGADVR